MIEIMLFHFSTKTEEKRGTIFSKLLFGGKILTKEAATKAAAIAARGVMRSIFTPEALLQSIDTRAQSSLTDTCIMNYSHVETEQGLSRVMHNLLLLPKRGKIYEVRKIMKNFVHHVFHLEHNSDPDKYPKHGDYVKCNYKRLTRFLVMGYGLEEKAVIDGLVELCLTGDGAEITGKHSGSQCAVGYKPTDEDAIDPLTGELVYYEMIEHEGRMRKRHKNLQKCYKVALAAISIKSETKGLIKYLFADFFEFGTTMTTEGLAASPFVYWFAVTYVFSKKSLDVEGLTK